MLVGSIIATIIRTQPRTNSEQLDGQGSEAAVVVQVAPVRRGRPRPERDPGDGGQGDEGRQ